MSEGNFAGQPTIQPASVIRHKQHVLSKSMARKTARGGTLVVGATGLIGQFVADASLATGRTTYVMVRSPPSSPSKAQIIKALQEKGAVILYGSIRDRDLMERKLRELEIEVVISTVGGGSILEQLILVEAIKSVGTVKRFLPSEFGHDVDRADPVEPGLTMYNEKRRVRRAVEQEGIPYTYICCNSIAAWPYYDNTHPCEVLPPLDRFQIYGDGSVKAYFVAGTDIGRFTMKIVDDVRTLNKNVHFRPSSNLHSINDLASIWEGKIGTTLPRVIITEDDLLAAAAENCIPRSIVAALTHDIFINGCQINFTIDGPKDVEATALYPEIPFRTVDDCFGDFMADIQVQPWPTHSHFPKYQPTENGFKTPNNPPLENGISANGDNTKDQPKENGINGNGEYTKDQPKDEYTKDQPKENGINGNGEYTKDQPTNDGMSSKNSIVERPAITATCG